MDRYAYKRRNDTLPKDRDPKKPYPIGKHIPRLPPLRALYLLQRGYPLQSRRLELLYNAISCFQLATWRSHDIEI